MKNHLTDTPTVRRLVEVSGAGHEAWSRAVIESTVVPTLHYSD